MTQVSFSMSAALDHALHAIAAPARPSALSGLLAGLCAAILMTAAAPLRAQEFDPPDTEYSQGRDEADPDTVRKLPLEAPYRAFLPVSVDLSYRLPEPGDQGHAGSCVAWAVAYAARSYYTSAYESRDTRLPANIASPGYVYNLAKQLAKKTGCESGLTEPQAVEVLKHGAPSLLDYPYHASNCDPPPTRTAIAAATDFRVNGLRKIALTRIDDVKGALARSHPVLLGVRDDIPFQRFRGAGVFDRTTVNESEKKGLHEVTIVGYDERKQAFRIINSWGKGWGDHGYAWISYDSFKARVTDLFVLEVARPKRPPPQPHVAVSPPPPQPHAAIVPPQPMPEPPRPSQIKPPTLSPVVQVKPPQAPAVPVNPAPVAPVRPPPAPELRPAPAPAVEVKPVPVAPVAIEPAPSPAPPAPPAPQQQSRFSDLAQMPCARVAVRHDGNRNVLDGYVGSDAALALVKQVAAETPGTAVGDVTVAPWPQCEAIGTLEKPLAVLDRPTIDIGPRDRLRAGETLHIAIRSPEQVSYLYVSYVQADGSVVHLVQPDGLVPQPTLPRQTLTFGDGANGGAKFTISRPFGREMIIAIASRSPLFDHPLPARQTEREYLTELRRALVYKPSPDLPDRELGASIKTLQTEGR